MGPVDPNGIYTFVFPQTTTLTMPNLLSSIFTVSSCTGFGGYHDNALAHLDDGGTRQIAYAAIPTCMGATVDDLTGVVSHEWVEAATDPVLAGPNGAFTFTGGPQAATEPWWRYVGGDDAWDKLAPDLRERMRASSQTIFGIELGTYERYLPDHETLAAAASRMRLLVSAYGPPPYTEAARRLGQRLGGDVEMTPGMALEDVWT